MFPCIAPCPRPIPCPTLTATVPPSVFLTNYPAPLPTSCLPTVHIHLLLSYSYLHYPQPNNRPSSHTECPPNPSPNNVLPHFQSVCLPQPHSRPYLTSASQCNQNNYLSNSITDSLSILTLGSQTPTRPFPSLCVHYMVVCRLYSESFTVFTTMFSFHSSPSLFLPPHPPSLLFPSLYSFMLPLFPPIPSHPIPSRFHLHLKELHQGSIFHLIHTSTKLHIMVWKQASKHAEGEGGRKEGTERK